jgi:putative ABC transport system ATP-binding protein
MLVAEGVSLSFSDRGGQGFVALHLPRFAPEPGALTVVSGPSGSGKSTLLYVLAGLQPPDAGVVRFADADVYSLGETRRDLWRRQNVGFVFQDFHLLPELSPISNVSIAATFSRPRKGIKERARALLSELGVEADRRSVETLSRGERQRVAIARALLFDPPVILADEPTASLDDAATEQVLSVLRELARQGKTVVMVSHEPRAIAQADQLVALARGHIVEPGLAA